MENSVEAVNGGWPRNRTKSIIIEYGKAILLALVLVLIIRTGIVQSFKIPSSSMEDTLLVGDFLLVNKFIYGINVPFIDLHLPGLRTPERGDVIVFRYPKDRSKDFIKRVIGLPGDEIRIRDKQVFINGTLYHSISETHKDPGVIPEGSDPRDNLGPVKVPADSYFVMGDNRDNSLDSRYWGFVNKKDLIGMAIIKWWSWDHENWRVRWQRIGRIIE